MHLPSLQKEMLEPHEQPETPWTKVGADLFSFNNRSYLVTVDYLLNFWEIDCLLDDQNYHLLPKEPLLHTTASPDSGNG